MRKLLLLIAALGFLAVLVVVNGSAFTAAQDPAPTPQGAAPTPQAAAPTPQGAAPTPQGAAPTPQGAAPTPQAAAPTPESAAATPLESKTQPKEVVLSKDSQSDKYGEAPFNHENHATKPYSIDGKSVISCVECHHTDQPASALQTPLKTSERETVLTAKLLEAADAKPVKSCRACHLQAGDDSAPLPAVTYTGKTTPTKLTNEVAYHLNCNVCHDKSIAARPALKGKIPGSNDCLVCHKPVG